MKFAEDGSMSYKILKTVYSAGHDNGCDDVSSKTGLLCSMCEHTIEYDSAHV